MKIINKIIKKIKYFWYVKYGNPYTSYKYYQFLGSRIGNNCRIYPCHFGSEPWLIDIGDHCTITGGVHFVTHDGGVWVFREEIKDINIYKPIKIGNNCFVGINAIIMPGVSIGDNVVVAAGSVVTKNIPDDEVWGGVPAKRIHSLKEYKAKKIEEYKLLRLPQNRTEWKKHLMKRFYKQ